MMLIDSSNKSRYLHHSTAAAGVTPSSNLTRRRRRSVVECNSEQQLIPTSLKSNGKDNRWFDMIVKNELGSSKKKENLIHNVEKYQEIDETTKTSISLNETLQFESSHQMVNSSVEDLFKFINYKDCSHRAAPSSEPIISMKRRMENRHRSTLSMSSTSGGSRRSCSFGSYHSNPEENHNKVQTNYDATNQNINNVANTNSYDTSSSDHLVPLTPERRKLRAETSTDRYHNRKKSGLKYCSTHLIWSIHVLLALTVIVVGYYNNQTPFPRKYILLPKQEGECQKFFVNAFSSSPTESDAFVCCEANNKEHKNSFYYSLTLKDKVCGVVYSNAVKNSVLSLLYSMKYPFASRLSKFPDAWLLPLFPILARLSYWLCCLIVNKMLLFSSVLFECICNKSNIQKNQLCNRASEMNSSRQHGTVDIVSYDETKRFINTSHPMLSSSSLSVNDFSATTTPTYFMKQHDLYLVRRTVLYISIMIFRGWILYVGLNKLEDNIIISRTGRTERNSISMGDNDSCWYRQYVPLSKQNQSCRGRDFDFSDHMVLYYAQILPISLAETLYSFRNPYWHQDNHYWTKVWPVMLGLCQVYLHLIASASAFKTVSYFHTAAEAFTGFAISSIVFVPLWWLQCSMTLLAKRGRSYFFGESLNTERI